LAPTPKTWRGAGTGFCNRSTNGCSPTGSARRRRCLTVDEDEPVGDHSQAHDDAVWALVHGLAFLHLDGKLDASVPEAVADRVRAAVHASLGVAAHRPEQ
jgi:hypothetical protein